MAAVELADVKVASDGGGDGGGDGADAPDKTGLSTARADALLEEFGKNEIPRWSSRRGRCSASSSSASCPS